MGMKKLSDEAISHINDRMAATGMNSLSATPDEIRMCAMACRIQELEESLKFMVDNIGQPVAIETRDGFNLAKSILDA